VKVLSVVGNRPQFIKSAPLSLALRETGIDEVVVHTGQHYDDELSAVFYAELGLAEPRYSLDLRTADPDAMQPPIAAAIAVEQPDWVLVYGDTNSTFAGACAARESGVRSAHVEAGLRSGDLAMPEERNRIAIDGLAELLLAPDERSREILAAEAVAGRVVVVGDVMADAARLFGPVAREWHPSGRVPGSYLVATVHREANVVLPRLGRIINGLNQLAEPVVFPAHPRTRTAIEREGLELAPHVELVPPLGYLELTSLVAGARVVLTDSGGLQKEAYWGGVPCVTLRPSTEWTDTVEVGANTLADDDPDVIVQAVSSARMPDDAPPLYGDGHASEHIAAALAEE
jgi:UDP-N-acetylglucosamine 2-epimerase